MRELTCDNGEPRVQVGYRYDGGFLVEAIPKHLDLRADALRQASRRSSHTAEGRDRSGSTACPCCLPVDA